MKPKTMMLMVVAIGCGLVASYMTSRLLAERNAAPPPEPKVAVLVAKAPVPAWVPIKEPEKYFELREVPESAAPKKAIKDFKDLKDQRLMTPLSEEEFVLQDKLLSKEQFGLAARMPPGARAIALKVNAECLAGGFVLPGSYVDVISTLRGGVSESVSKIIMQNMLVLAVDTNAQRDPQQPAMLGSTVTLAAKPEEATRLSLASSLGELRLALRGMGDNALVKLAGTRYDDMDKPIHDTTGGVPEVVEAPAPPPVPARLPALPSTAAPVIAQKEEAAPVVEAAPAPPTHTMTIFNGDAVQKAVFVLENDGQSWSDNGPEREGETAGKSARKPAAPPAPRGGALDPLQDAQPNGNAAGGQGASSSRRRRS